VGLNPGCTNTQGLQLRRKCSLCDYMCKWLDYLVFSDTRTTTFIHTIQEEYEKEKEEKETTQNKIIEDI